MGVTLAMATIVALAGSGIYLGLKTFENYNPGKKKIQKDLQLLKNELAPLVEGLVPWTDEEMKQLSLNNVKGKNSKGVTHTKKGVLTTIYHEPLLAWVYRKYVSSKENALAFARTTKHEFTYRTKKNRTDVVVNNQLIGQIDEEGILYPMKGGKPIGRINRNATGQGLPITINEREVGRMNDPKHPVGANPRAFKVVSQMDGNAEQIFLAIAIFELITQQLKS